MDALFSDYTISILTFASIWGILVLSLNILLGYSGQVSLGHAAFFGIGAYAAAIAATRYGIPFLLTIPISMVVTALIGGLLGLPSLRVRHDFLVLVTIGLNFIVVGTFAYVDFFGGAMGITGIPVPSAFGVKLQGIAYWLFTTAALVLTAWFCWYLPRTWGGLGMAALRDDETAAEAVGIGHARYKIIAFALSGALAGLGGALYAPFVGNVFPDRFGFIESITLVSMLIFGGVGTVRGAIFGGMFLKSLPELLRTVMGEELIELRFAFYGAILLLIIIFLPQGVLGDNSPFWKGVVRLWRQIRGEPEAPAPPAPVPVQAAVSESTGGDVLDVHDVAVHFGSLKALDGVSLTAHGGEILGLIGPNGAGKTTLFNAITGFVPVTRGEILINGREIQGKRPPVAARAGVARTFQIVRPFAEIDVQNNVLTGLGLRTYPQVSAFARPKDAGLEEARGITARVGLGDRAANYPGELPIGLLRRLEVGRALATDARFLLLDEPAAGLTHEEVEELKQVVRDLAAQGHGVILVEHNMQFAMSVCERIVVLARRCGSLQRDAPVHGRRPEPVRSPGPGDRHAQSATG